MESLGEILNPNSRLSKRTCTFQTRDHWLYVCNFCGAWIDPKDVENEGHHYYARGECQCPGAVEARAQVVEDKERQCRESWVVEIMSRRHKYGLVGALATQTFETFDRKVQPEAYDVALSFFDKPRSIVFAGKTNGLGKTHLMAAIANRCVEQGKRVKFGTLAEYLAGIRATYNQEAEVRTDHYIEGLTHSYLLCIDDLGKERLTQWAQEQLFLIVNARYNLRPQGHMILTSNAEGQRLAASMGIHNWSRLQEIGTVVYMRGNDYRLRRKG